MSKEQYIVVSDRPIWVRKEPSISSKTVGLIYPNEMIVVEAKNNNFLKTSKGWVAEYTANGTQRLVEKYDSVNDIALMSADYGSGKYLEEESNVTDSRVTWELIQQGEYARIESDYERCTITALSPGYFQIKISAVVGGASKVLYLQVIE